MKLHCSLKVVEETRKHHYSGVLALGEVGGRLSSFSFSCHHPFSPDNFSLGLKRRENGISQEEYFAVISKPEVEEDETGKKYFVCSLAHFPPSERSILSVVAPLIFQAIKSMEEWMSSGSEEQIPKDERGKYFGTFEFPEVYFLEKNLLEALGLACALAS
jgi:hypothetical protein